MQALLLYELANKNHLKNINDQNFAHFMRGYDKGFYGNKHSLQFNIYSQIILRNFYKLLYFYYAGNKEKIWNSYHVLKHETQKLLLLYK